MDMAVILHGLLKIVDKFNTIEYWEGHRQVTLDPVNLTAGFNIHRILTRLLGPPRPHKELTMKIETRCVYDVLVVDMAGKLDTHTSGDASDRMIEIVQGGDKQIVLNLDMLEYVSSAGLRVILRASKLLQNSNGEIKICHANGVVEEVLQTSGFNSLLNVYDTEKEAVAAFAG